MTLAKLGRSSSRFSAVSEPFLDPNGRKFGFALGTAEERLKRSAHAILHDRAPHLAWVYSATVGDSIVGASIFPRRRGRARRGALRQEFRGEYLNLGGTRGGTR